MAKDYKSDLASLRLSIKSDDALNASHGKHFAAGDKVRVGKPTLRWGSVEVGGDEPGAAAMSAALLTVIKASYRHVKVSRAEEACKLLGLGEADLPNGFYVISGDGKIAAALFPYCPKGASFKKEKNPNAELFKARSAPGGALAMLVEPGAFCSDMRFDVDKLFDNARNFALALMTKKSSSKESYESFGFAASSTILDADSTWSQEAQKGYPAFVDFGDAPLGELASAKNYEISFLKCMGLPIHNHCGYSLINNVRELLTAKEREPERAEIFESLVDKWLEAKLTETSQREDQLMQAAGVDDEDGSYWKSKKGQAHARVLRAKSNKVGRTSSIGSERQMVCNPNSTSYFNHGLFKMIGSLDFALVDGQHSSIDYAILASAVDVQARKASPEEWLGYGRGAESSAPESLRARFVELLASQGAQKGMSKEQRGKEQTEELWQDFAKFCRGATTTIRVTEEANPSNQVKKVNEANNRRAQKAEAMSMLERKDEISDFVELVNEEAMRRGNPVMLAQTKSLVSNEDFAGVSAASVIEFEKLFPALYAVSRSPDGSKSGARKSTVLFGAGAEGDAVIASQLGAALGLRKNAVKMENLVDRARALVDFVGKFKSRELKIAESSLAAFFGKNENERGTFDHIAGLIAEIKPNGKVERGGAAFNLEGFRELAVEESELQRKKWGKRFDAFADFVQKKIHLFAVGASEFELERPTRARIAYAIFERALILTQAIETGQAVSHVMSSDLCENVMLSVSRVVNKKKFGSASTECAEEIATAIGRVKDLSVHRVANKENNFNSAREMLAGLIKGFESASQRGEPGAFNLAKMAPEALAVLLDAMPCGKMQESLAIEICKKHGVDYIEDGSLVGDKLKERRKEAERLDKLLREEPKTAAEATSGGRSKR